MRSIHVKWGGVAKKFVACMSTVALVCATVVPSAFAANRTSWDVPTAASATTDASGARYVTCATAVSGTNTSEILGLSKVLGNEQETMGLASSEDYKSNTALGIFGTSVNENPDPYIANYFYNMSIDAGDAAEGAEKADDATLISSNVAIAQGSFSYDGSDAAFADVFKYRPDVFCVRGVSSNYVVTNLQQSVQTINAYTSDDANYQAAVSGTYSGDENYDPYIGGVEQQTFEALQAVHEMAVGVNDLIDTQKEKYGVNLTTRYEDPEVIADKLEVFYRGLYDYMLKETMDSKKTVAIVTAIEGNDKNATVKLLPASSHKSGQVSGTGWGHLAAALYSITDNLANVLNPDLEPGAAVQECTVADLAKADCIVLAYAGNSSPTYDGANANGNWDANYYTTTLANIKDALLDAGATKLANKTVYSCNAKGTTGNGSQVQVDKMQSDLGVIGFVYPEYVNAYQLLAYYYENFLHVKTSALPTVVSIMAYQMSAADGVDMTESIENYSADAIEAKCLEGLQYYVDNQEEIDAAAPWLTPATYTEDGVEKTYIDLPAKTPAKEAVTSVTINKKTVTSDVVENAIGENTSTVVKVTLGSKVKTIKAKAFKGTKVKTLVVKTKNLVKSSVKNALKGSKVISISVNVSSKKATNKTYVKTYKKIFTKDNCGVKVSVAAA